MDISQVVHVISDTIQANTIISLVTDGTKLEMSTIAIPTATPTPTPALTPISTVQSIYLPLVRQ